MGFLYTEGYDLPDILSIIYTYMMKNLLDGGIKLNNTFHYALIILTIETKILAPVLMDSAGVVSKQYARNLPTFLIIACITP